MSHPHWGKIKKERPGKSFRFKRGDLYDLFLDTHKHTTTWKLVQRHPVRMTFKEAFDGSNSITKRRSFRRIPDQVSRHLGDV